ncbi:MAG: hypothetical protein GX352_02755 [Clostridiales bacterium]|nr:hypothetical protein [Clostridiales bacterium]
MKSKYSIIALLLVCLIFITACNSRPNEPDKSNQDEGADSITAQGEDDAPEPEALAIFDDAQNPTIPEEIDWKSIYKEFLLEYSEPEGDNVLFGISLMDINADGVPELILSSSAYMRSNYIYTISEGEVIQSGGFGTNYEEQVSKHMGVKLCKNKHTGDVQWIATAGISEDDDDGIRTT